MRREPTLVGSGANSNMKKQIQCVGIMLIVACVIMVALSTRSLNDYHSKISFSTKIKFGADDEATDETVEEKRAQLKRQFSILPKKIYSVIGLESSGTQFVSKIIQDALQKGPYRSGSFPCCGSLRCSMNCGLWLGKKEYIECLNVQNIANNRKCNETSDVQVQHFSLPFGSTCDQFPHPPIVDVVLPSQCTRNHKDPTEVQECNAMSKELWGFELNGKAMVYPPRYQLDISAQIKYYRSKGVDQVFVIVLRDQDISFIARGDAHCRDVKLREIEELVGKDLIIDAINTHILGNEEEHLTRGTLSHWVAKSYEQTKQHRSARRQLTSLPLKRDNAVVVVSYESLMNLGKTYVQLLYQNLGIDSDLIPHMQNGNTKYLNTTNTMV
jgi:hypothetical protein